MTRPGMLCRATKVAAAICQALEPESSHFGDGTSMDPPLLLQQKPNRKPIHDVEVKRQKRCLRAPSDLLDSPISKIYAVAIPVLSIWESCSISKTGVLPPGARAH